MVNLEEKLRFSFVVGLGASFLLVMIIVEGEFMGL